MLRYITRKRKVNYDEDVSGIVTDNVNQKETPDEITTPDQNCKKYKDKYQSSWLDQFKWLKFCPNTEKMTCHYCKEFSSTCYKTSTLTKHGTSATHMRRVKQALENEKNRNCMEKAVNNAVKKADTQIMGFMKTAYFITRNVNCETDFVSRNVKFQDLVVTGSNLLLKQYLETNFTENEVSKVTVSKLDLENLKTSNSLTPRLSDLVAANVNLIGENIVLRRGIVIRANKGCLLSSYAHPPLTLVDDIFLGKYGAFVVYRTIKDLPEDSDLTLPDIGKQLCQHIIGRNPKAVGSKDIDNPVENEEEETNLLFQEYLLNSEYTVGEYLEEYGLEVIDFMRFECGESVI